MPVLLAVVAALVLLLIVDQRHRRTVWRQDAELRRLRAVFDRFVEANRHGSMSESAIDRFLVDTAEVESLFHESALPRLRLELHDHALRLQRLNVALEHAWGGVERRAAIVGGRDERRAWFTRVAASLDTVFERARLAPLERFNRVIRA